MSISGNFIPFKQAIVLKFKLMKARGIQSIDTFVLMIDETIKFMNTVKQNFPNDMDPELIMVPFRVRFLNYGMDGTSTSSLLSTLSTDILGYTDSGRQIIPIPIAAKLSPSEIVDKWWSPISISKMIFKANCLL